MDGLREEFDGEIEFFDLNVDDPSLDELREAYGITGRSQYVFLDEEGNVVQRWFGPLTAEAMSAQFDALIARSQ